MQETRIAASDGNWNLRKLPVELEKDCRYTITADDIVLEEGTTQAIGIRVRDSQSSKTYAEGIIDITCPGNDGVYSWSFVCPEVDDPDTLEVLLYAGIPGQTAGNGILLKNLQIVKNTVNEAGAVEAAVTEENATADVSNANTGAVQTVAYTNGFKFEMGTISGGADRSSDTRIRMTGMAAVQGGATVNVDSNFAGSYNWGIQTYDESGSYIAKDYGWMTATSFVIPDGVAFIRINCKRNDGSVMSTDDIEAAEHAFSMEGASIVQAATTAHTTGTVAVQTATPRVTAVPVYSAQPVAVVTATGYVVRATATPTPKATRDGSEATAFRFEIGTISDGVKYDAPYRMRMTERMAVRAGDTLYVDADFVNTYSWGIQTFDAAGNYIRQDYGWLTDTSFVIPEGVAYMQINCLRIDSKAMTDEDLETAEHAFSFEADPNARTA